ncbi:hypothetical protein HMPREF9622_00734 [Cutibacterium modestum HL037PA3]|uniref:Uncharacterized protein n=1 Tax=Cutibacterium modestum HL044PA1 TaxID=765109 RepID=A0ABN0C460_9ACTN|nr:hypothetical protein HMPREF9621_01310 [Cutibacterium modestum HL037PA2]EFS91908.1 hypothetical protein HMPREF9607_01881 [Cutibacterium modestum HL044PA1]EFT16173.1 hypothetical protein HMPREF9622_00734 [Cutibacterium modestum HL037PA3]
MKAALAFFTAELHRPHSSSPPRPSRPPVRERANLSRAVRAQLHDHHKYLL